MSFHGKSMVVVCALLASSGIMATGARGSSVQRMSDDTLVRKATVIIEGRILRATSAWNADHTQIHTKVVVSIQGIIKGNIQNRRTLELNVLGGRVGDTVMEVVGGNHYRPGEELFLFIEAPDSLLPVVGLFQGKLAIDTDPVTGVEKVSTRNETRVAFRTRIAGIVATQAQQQEGN